MAKIKGSSHLVWRKGFTHFYVHSPKFFNLLKINKNNKFCVLSFAPPQTPL